MNHRYDAKWQEEQMMLAIDYFVDLLPRCQSSEEWKSINDKIGQLESKLEMQRDLEELDYFEQYTHDAEWEYDPTEY
jgi:hypothetical protein